MLNFLKNTIKFDTFIIISRLLEGEFLDYNKAIPKNFSIKACANTREFINVIDRVSLIITERLKNPVKLNINDGFISVKCATEIGAVYDEIDADEAVAISKTEKGTSIKINFENSDGKTMSASLTGSLTIPSEPVIESAEILTGDD